MKLATAIEVPSGAARSGEVHTVVARSLALPLAACLLAAGVFFGVLWLAVRGVLPGAAASLLVPASFLAICSGAWQTLRALAVVGSERPLLERPGFWLVALLAALELPGLGSFGLIDPWESHYAEVAREMLARGDFISTWWGHEGWFMSKPVLTFWLEALCMRALGVEPTAGAMLDGAFGGWAHPEWAVRLPGALFAIAGCGLLYRGVAACAGRRAGWIAGAVLATTSQWALAARHALTDTPFVGALAACAGLWLLADNTPDTSLFVRRRVMLGRVGVPFSASALSLGAIAVAVGAQIGALLGRGFELNFATWPPRLQVVADTLMAGSPGNCGLPGQPACGPSPLVHPGLTPALQAALWGSGLVVLLISLARERRVREHLLLGAWFCMGIATLAKGIAGFALPLAVVALSRLLGARPHAPSKPAQLWRGGLLLVLLVAPWYGAMFARHGRLIFDELVFKHMLGRALDHLHDTNSGEDTSVRYYLWQLGYALFPWTALVPGALASAGARRADGSPSVARLRGLALLWLLLTLSLFSVMRTKFHHYILPALPALAVLVGTYVSERWRATGDDRHRARMAVVLACGGALLVARVGCDLVTPIEPGISGAARLFHLLSYQYRRAWPAELDFRSWLITCSAAATLISLGVGSARWRRPALAAQLALSMAFAGWLGHIYLPALSPSFGQRRVIEAFQCDRSSAAEPLIAYQLNWKGENFYTGNHLAIFVSSGARFRRYLRERRQADPVLHVVLETHRLPALRAELGAVHSLEVLTDRGQSDKICLVRVRLR